MYVLQETIGITLVGWYYKSLTLCIFLYFRTSYVALKDVLFLLILKTKDRSCLYFPLPERWKVKKILLAQNEAT